MYHSNFNSLEQNISGVNNAQDLYNERNEDILCKQIRSSTPQNLDELCSPQSVQNQGYLSDLDSLHSTKSDIHYCNFDAVNVNDIVQEAPIYANHKDLLPPSDIENISLIHHDNSTGNKKSLNYILGNGKNMSRNRPEDINSESASSSSLTHHCQNVLNQSDSKCCEDIRNKSEIDSQSSICYETIDNLCQKPTNYYHIATSEVDNLYKLGQNTGNSENIHYDPTSQLAADVNHDMILETPGINYISNNNLSIENVHGQNDISKSIKSYLWEMPKHSKSNKSELDIPSNCWNSEQSITSEMSCEGLKHAEEKTKSHWVSMSDESYDTKNDTGQDPSEYDESLQHSQQNSVLYCGNENCHSVRPKIKKNSTGHPSQNGSEGYISMYKSDENHDSPINIQVTMDSRCNSSEFSLSTDNISRDGLLHSANINNFGEETSHNQGCIAPHNAYHHYRERIPHYGSIGLPSLPVNQSNQNLQNKTQSVTKRKRHRSGSWTGVNESEDEVEEISRENQNPLILSHTSNSINGMQASTTHELQNSYQTTYRGMEDSCRSASESMVPHYDKLIDEEDIKRKLKFHYLNPLEKFEIRRRFPWKLMVQVIKIIICTIQLGMFASQRYSHVTYLWDTKVSLSHLFIKSWDSTREVVAYPPATGPLAVYTLDEYYGFIDFSIHSFSEIEKTAIGAYKYQRRRNGKIVMPEFCITKYKNGFSDVNNLTFNLDNSILSECFSIPPWALDFGNFSMLDYLETKNKSINFDLLLESSFAFDLETVKLRSDFPYENPECYRLETVIYFDNNDHDGQMLVDLDIGAKVLDCQGNLTDSSSDSNVNPYITTLNVSTISVCVISLILCCRALFRAQILKSSVKSCFRFRFGRDLTKCESFEFVNLWYVLICVNDFLIIVGSVIKMSLEGQDYEGYLDKWNVCSLLLGIGNLFIWFGCLRYLGFFETYNVLILTMKHCIPNIMRYSICTLMLFAGYSLCGWLVLGPYHIKFRSLSTTFECLFSLINGDDMFATFSSTIGKDYLVWWFSRIFVYSFTSLFIYVILSLAIAVITDTYYTVLHWYKVGYPESELQKYAKSCRTNYDSSNPEGNQDPGEAGRTFKQILKSFFCCGSSCLRQRNRGTEGYEALSS